MYNVTTQASNAATAGGGAHMSAGGGSRQGAMRHRGRGEQVLIYVGKMLRMFVYQSDWKVLPMAAVIASLVAMAVRQGLFTTMEGTLKGAFALTCVGIWNGFFNSIQVICRERGIVKREHRSGMHISSYVLAHMIYQALLCLGQTGITMYVFNLVGVAFPEQGVFTPFMVVDMAGTLFLITYAADMLSLFVSAIVHSTTTAMTVMPFILIFQLVFSGGIFALPQWCGPISNLTISSYGLSCLAAQGNYNELPMASGWSTLEKLRDKEFSGNVSLQELLDAMPESAQKETLDAATAMMDRSEKYPVTIKVDNIIQMIGEDQLRSTIERETAAASRSDKYELSRHNITMYWVRLAAFVFVFAGLTIASLEFIDKDRR